MDKELLKKSFKEHKIFNSFWSDAIMDCFDDNIILGFVPQEYVGFYQKVFELVLTRVGENDNFVNEHANITIKLTSVTGDSFDVDKAIKEIDNLGATSAILVKVQISDNENSVIFSTQFNLGSSEEEKIETTSKYIKKMSIFY